MMKNRRKGFKSINYCTKPELIAIAKKNNIDISSAKNNEDRIVLICEHISKNELQPKSK